MIRQTSHEAMLMVIGSVTARNLYCSPNSNSTPTTRFHPTINAATISTWIHGEEGCRLMRRHAARRPAPITSNVASACRSDR